MGYNAGRETPPDPRVPDLCGDLEAHGEACGQHVQGNWGMQLHPEDPERAT